MFCPGELLINLPETSESTKSNKEKLENACIYQQIMYTLTRMIRQGKKTEFLIYVGAKTHDNVSLKNLCHWLSFISMKKMLFFG